ncbi:MAG: hypothetical protein Q4D62_07800 [Planctomycetia bacterium]|nr:hypothetical protein [Planctomycetia bacterium]
MLWCPEVMVRDGAVVDLDGGLGGCPRGGCGVVSLLGDRGEVVAGGVVGIRFIV